MSDILQAKSPLGYTVHCSEDYWNDHIISRHPIMNKKKINVKNTIEKPIAIYQSEEYNNRDVYFGSFDVNNNLYTKVIVAPTDPNNYLVISAFPNKGISGNINSEVLKYDATRL